MTPTVFFIDDAPDLDRLAAPLLEADGFAVETHLSPRGFLKAFDPSRPGCIVCRDRFRRMSVPTLLRRIRQSASEIPVLVVTDHGDVPAAVRAVKAGATNALEYPVAPEVLREHVRRAVRKDAADRAARPERVQIAQRYWLLSEKERQILPLVVHGRSNREIADHFGSRPRTIESQRASMMRKLGAESLSHLVRIATQYLPGTLNVNQGVEPPPG